MLILETVYQTMEINYYGVGRLIHEAIQFDPKVRIYQASTSELFGKAVKMDERNFDSVTGLSGSGPAYIFLFMEALVEAGVNLGIPVEDAKKLVFKTALGAARVAWESKKDMAELIKTITSPGGTTIEGLKEFEKAGLKKIVSSAVFAAAKRAKELSGAG